MTEFTNLHTINLLEENLSKLILPPKMGGGLPRPPPLKRHITNHQLKKKWSGGGTPQGHIINQSIDPRGNNNPTLPLISKQ